MDTRYASLVFVPHPHRGRPRTLDVRRGVLVSIALLILMGIPARAQLELEGILKPVPEPEPAIPVR